MQRNFTNLALPLPVAWHVLSSTFLPWSGSACPSREVAGFNGQIGEKHRWGFCPESMPELYSSEQSNVGLAARHLTLPGRNCSGKIAT